jgi:hypothetical protein
MQPTIHKVRFLQLIFHPLYQLILSLSLIYFTSLIVATHDLIVYLFVRERVHREECIILFRSEYQAEIQWLKINASSKS